MAARRVEEGGSRIPPSSEFGGERRKTSPHSYSRRRAVAWLLRDLGVALDPRVFGFGLRGGDVMDKSAKIGMIIGLSLGLFFVAQISGNEAAKESLLCALAAGGCGSTTPEPAAITPRSPSVPPR